MLYSVYVHIGSDLAGCLWCVGCWCVCFRHHVLRHHTPYITEIQISRISPICSKLIITTLCIRPSCCISDHTPPPSSYAPS
ncbi:hypothetical protein EON63_11705 [archaeon]|nr:MAG: hypothetical protein EON63_11705 [archaeon]